MRKLAIVVVVILVILVGLLLALPHIIDVNQYRGQIQSELQQRLNRPVQLGELSLAVFPMRVEANNVTIGDDPSLRSNVPFAQVAAGHQRQTASAADQERRNRKPGAEASARSS